jgi:type I restriction enzyme S subunit
MVVGKMSEITSYEKMKDSGIEWIGSVPSDWRVHTLYQLVTQVKEKNSNLQEKNLLSLSYGKIKRKDIDSPDGLLPASFDGYNIIENGDIVLRLTDLQNDHTSLRVGLATERGIITSAYTTLRPIDTSNSKYLFYLLHAFDLKKGFYGMGSGVRQGLNYAEVKELRIVLPSQKEQDAIVYFLDDQCSEIDLAIDEAKSSIQDYKTLKANIISTTVLSGLDGDVDKRKCRIEWVPSIPSHWDTARFVYKNWIRSRLGWKGLKAEEYVEDGYPFLSAFNINNNYLCWEQLNYITQERYDESPEIKLRVGDILLVKDGAGIGKCARIDSLPLGESTVNGSLAVITPNEDLDYRYEYYYLQCNVFQNIIARLRNGMGVPHLTQEAMKEIVIPLPPREEQEQIANFLDTECRKIDEIIELKNLLIIELEMYKRSLIFETVTGKRKVV